MRCFEFKPSPAPLNDLKNVLSYKSVPLYSVYIIASENNACVMLFATR